MAKAKKTNERPVVVTTVHRLVAFGYATDTTGETIFLRAMRNCLYWPREQKGFIGLAAAGPVEGCRVGPAADGTLRNVTSVLECTPEAVARWEAGPWA